MKSRETQSCSTTLSLLIGMAIFGSWNNSRCGLQHMSSHAQWPRLVWLCNPLDCSPPGSSVHDILQARILGCVTISSFRESFQPGKWSRSPASLALAGRFFTTEQPGKPLTCMVRAISSGEDRVEPLSYRLATSSTWSQESESKTKSHSWKDDGN